MRFSTDAKTLKKALRMVRGATGKLPILSSVRIEVDGLRASVSATDIETSLTIALDGDKTYTYTHADHGVAVVPLKPLEAALKTLEGEITLEGGARRVSVNESGTPEFGVSVGYGGGGIYIAGHDPKEYPTLPEVGGELSYLENLEGLRVAIDAVSHAVSTDETRYNLNGIAVDADTFATVRCIATDGHRLCVADAGPVSLPWERVRIIPLKSAKLLAKLLKDGNDCARIACDGQRIAFHGEGFSLLVRCIEDEYPNWQNVVPKDIGETVRVDRDALLEGIARVEPASSDRSRAILLKLNGGIDLEAENPNTGSASAHVDCVRGEPAVDKDLAFNARYLREAANTFGKGELAIDLKASVILEGARDQGKIPDYACSPIKIHHAGEAFPFCVVMPMRV